MIYRDRFGDARSSGRVVGSREQSVARGGVDVEGAFSIDNQALRIRPLLEAGWQRACLSYGPVERKAGLAFAVHILNCHNTSQAEPLLEPFGSRVRAWLFGSKTLRARQRLWNWLRSGRVRRVLRQMRWWKALDRQDAVRLDENLAIGWFTEEVANPVRDGAAFVMHATGAENGELWARTGGGFAPVIRGVQNVPIYYVVVLRERDVVFYAGATTPAVYGLPAYPNLRPIAIGPLPESGSLWPAIHQSVLGQIGFRSDTRVYGTGVDELPAFAARFGGALHGESFEGADALGAPWRSSGAALMRTARGLAVDGRGAATATLAAPVGLLRATFDCSGSGSIALAFRGGAASDRWELAHDGSGFELAVVAGGARTVVATETRTLDSSCEIQIADDGATIALTANGKLLFGKRIEDTRLADGNDIGIWLAGTAAAGPWLREIEAQPRTFALPAAFDFGKPWCRTGAEIVVADDFDGAAGALHGRVTPVGGRRWTRTLGTGEFDLTGDGAAKVRATRERPCPERTFYTVDWTNPDFADVEVTITPPGTGRGNWDHGSTGFVLWQDADHYLAINIWLSDSYTGASISSFFTVGGWEDLYDAIWSNVGARVRHGVPVKLRVVFDGLNYLIFVDGVAVLYRKLTDVYADCKPFRINKVGLLANWEWGTDTGSKFEGFRGRV